MSYTHLDLNGDPHELTTSDGLVLRQVERYVHEKDNSKKADLLFGLLMILTKYEHEDEDDLLRTLCGFQTQLNTYRHAIEMSRT